MAATSQNGASTHEAHAGELFAGILQSAAFVKAPSLRQLLTFLWEHRDGTISEYTLGTEALGRPASFDPRVDATVRVVVARLRQRLKDYYLSEGTHCPLRLSVPLGGHQLVVEFLAPETVLEAPAPEAPSPSPRRPFPWIPSAVVFTAAAAGLFIGILVPRPGEPRPVLPRFWSAFLQGGNPTSLYVPTPVFISWPGSPVRMRDVRINDARQMLESAEIAELAKRLGPPRITRNYAVGRDTFAAVKLVQFLEKRGIHVQMAGTDSIASGEPPARNAVLTGTSWNNPGVKALVGGANFQIAAESTDVILNHAPRPGERPEYRPRDIAGGRSAQYGVILQRTSQTGTRQLALAGFHPEALVSFLTEPGPLAELESAWQSSGSPSDFEALVEVETEGERIAATKLESFRILTVTH
ncbi:hypothetical protein [Paludibaculum fermentans]|uniref:hypothetical protein n=1 Tax=Paludibaculum fermentans TaxID=1473598 RepID=UPI003EBC018F